MKILSIDLASKKYTDFGWAQLEIGSHIPSFPTAYQLGLTDPHTADRFSETLHQYCVTEQITVLLLDGPQGWRHPLSPINHMRLCERVLNTPGKTGEPGFVKPKTYFHYISFSIEVFKHLNQLDWSLLYKAHLNRLPERVVIECFPSYCWRTLGLPKLPAKSRIKPSALEPYRRSLVEMCGYELPESLSHDELQATVQLPVGEALAHADHEALVMTGVDPIIEDDTVYEGWIPLPRIS